MCVRKAKEEFKQFINDSLGGVNLYSKTPDNIKDIIGEMGFIVRTHDDKLVILKEFNDGECVGLEIVKEMDDIGYNAVGFIKSELNK